MFEGGGLYFTDDINYKKWIGYGSIIAIIKLLPDAEYYMEPCGTKYKASKFEVTQFININSININDYVHNITLLKMLFIYNFKLLRY